MDPILDVFQREKVRKDCKKLKKSILRGKEVVKRRQEEIFHQKLELQKMCPHLCIVETYDTRGKENPVKVMFVTTRMCTCCEFTENSWSSFSILTRVDKKVTGDELDQLKKM